VDPDLQILPKHAPPNKDALLPVFATQTQSSKTQRKNARKPTEPRDSATSPLEPAFKFLNLLKIEKPANIKLYHIFYPPLSNW